MIIMPNTLEMISLLARPTARPPTEPTPKIAFAEAPNRIPAWAMLAETTMTSVMRVSTERRETEVTANLVSRTRGK